MASLTFILRTEVDPGTLIPAVTRTMFQLDPRVGLARMTTFDALVSLRLRERRFMLTLLGAFAVTAVVIALVGVFGAMSQAVAERAREIGVRMALGASPSTVLGEFLAEAGRTAAIGHWGRSRDRGVCDQCVGAVSLRDPADGRGRGGRGGADRGAARAGGGGAAEPAGGADQSDRGVERGMRALNRLRGRSHRGHS